MHDQTKTIDRKLQTHACIRLIFGWNNLSGIGPKSWLLDKWLQIIERYRRNSQIINPNKKMKTKTIRWF